jgi:hypothetical protein
MFARQRKRALVVIGAFATGKKARHRSRWAALAAMAVLTGCDAPMRIGSMLSEPISDDGSRGPVDASVDSRVDDVLTDSVGVLDRQGEAGTGGDTTDLSDASRDGGPPRDVDLPDAVLPDGSAPPDGVEPPDGSGPIDATTDAPPRDVASDAASPDAVDLDVLVPDAPTCPSSLRAPIVCVAADASAPEAVIESCPTASRTLYQEEQILGSLRADALGVYWRSNDLGLRVLRTGAAAPELLGFVGPYPFLLDDNAIYYATDEHAVTLDPAGHVDIMKMKRDATGLTFLATAVTGSEIALGGDRLYFNPAPDALGSVSKAGGAVLTVVTGRPIANVVADATHVYWSERTSDAAINAPSAIWRAAHGSTTPELVTTGLTVRAMSQEGGSLIVLSQDETPAGELVASYLLEVGKASGGCPQVLAYLPASLYSQRISSLVVDSRAIYWTASATDHTEYSVWYAPRAGGIAVRASTALIDDCLAITQNQVFWADRIPAFRTFATLIKVMDRP